MKMNKCTSLLAITGISLLTAIAHAAPVDVAENGGFETGNLSGWTPFDFGGGVNGVTNLNPSSGTWASSNNCTGGPCDALIKNANKGIGVVTPFQAITVSFDYRGTTADGGVIFAELFSELDGGGVSKAELLGGGPLFPNADPDVWQTAVFNTTLGSDVAGGVTLQLKSSCGAAPTCLADIYFDNASMVVDVSEIPIPAAAWLFGSGLIGLVGVARRKLKAA
jgi:hypothetical protein